MKMKRFFSLSNKIFGYSIKRSSNHHLSNQVGLGRWKTGGNEKEISIKVFQANEDHCGICSDQVLKEKSELINDDEYYRYML